MYVKNKEIKLSYELGKRAEDITGRTFGKLYIIEYDHTHSKSGTYWKCSCDCGSNKICIISRHCLNNGSVKSCGCLAKEAAKNRRDNLVGKKFNMLKVLYGEYDKEKTMMYWICKCDCDNKDLVKAVGADLKSGKTKSCGCFKARRLKKGESSFNMLYSNYKSKSKRIGLEFNLTIEEFKKIVDENCFYCDIEPKQISAGKRRYGNYIYNGIDRIDSDKGYTIENSVPCCKQCNVSKNNYTKEEFYTWAKKLYKNLEEKRNVY